MKRNLTLFIIFIVFVFAYGFVYLKSLMIEDALRLLSNDISELETENGNLRKELSEKQSLRRIENTATGTYKMKSPGSFEIIIIENEE